MTGGLNEILALLSISNITPAERIVAHNYGHGGAGVSLSWGCAREITDLVAAALPRVT